MTNGRRCIHWRWWISMKVKKYL